jgi:hypothetical protein
MRRSKKWVRGLWILVPLVLTAIVVMAHPSVFAQTGETSVTTPPAHAAGGEASLVLPDLGQATFFGGTNGRSILMIGIVVSLLGLVFGLLIYTQLKNLPVHQSMLEISELIYETCKTYLLQQASSCSSSSCSSAASSSSITCSCSTCRSPA